MLASKEDLTDEQKTLVEFVTKRYDASAKVHKDIDPRFDIWYGLSRNYKKLKRQASQARTENDRDTLNQEFRRVFGDDLFVPWIYTVIETVLPGILSTDPAISVKPNNEEPATLAACDPVKHLFERDQKRISYEMILQETVRSGLRYGIGVQKLWWEKCYRSGKKIAPMTNGPGYQVVNDSQMLVYEGPQAENIDIRDFFWDPVARSIKTCSYLLHRTLRSMEYIEERVAEGKERRAKGETGGWAELDLEKVKGMASTTKRGEVWAGRNEAAGLSQYEAAEGNELYEIWEYHDRSNVYTILNRELLVQEAENPFLHGDFPFQIFRPTIVEQELVGIGQAEPIAHLQYELNAMRGQRRDAATFSMNRGYFFSRGMLEPANMVTGIGAMVPVDGDPKDVVYPMPFTEVPNSGVEEEQALKADIEMTTGISESVVGSGGEETATGTQLVQQAANKRIKQMVKNLHVDLLRPATAQMQELYKQHIVDPEAQQQTIRVEGAAQQPEGASPSYSFVDVGPEQIQADLDIEPIDGSTEPENIAQKRADAVQFVDAVSPFSEHLDQKVVLTKLLRDYGVDKPEEFLKSEPEADQVVEAIGKAAQQMGMPEEQIHALLEAGLSEMQEPSEPESGGASQNGSAPEPAATGG